MDIAIRETVEADLADIYRIRCDPLVQPHQYKLTRDDTVDRWKTLLFGDKPPTTTSPTYSSAWQLIGINCPVDFRCTTIVRDNEVIGHINQFHYEVDGLRTCICGWNLAPTYWGQGIAVIALSQLFDSFFGDQQIEYVISDCFSNNQRCIRVLQKLNFEPIGITPFERLQIAIENRCLHWIRRFQLTA